jgi:hypothetical protein
MNGTNGDVERSYKAVSSKIKIVRLFSLVWIFAMLYTAFEIYQTGEFPKEESTVKTSYGERPETPKEREKVGVRYLKTFALYSIPRAVVVIFYLAVMLYVFGDKIELPDGRWAFIGLTFTVAFYFGIHFVLGQTAFQWWGIPYEYGKFLWCGAWLILALGEHVCTKELLFGYVQVEAGESEEKGFNNVG